MPAVTVPSGELHYDVTEAAAPWLGTPEAILFHHGLGSSSGAWAPWLPALVDRYRMVRYDMRGHGRSTAAAGLALSLDRLADDVIAVADAAGAERFHLVGESIGGTIALHAALRHRRRLLTVTVSNGAHIGGSIRSVDDWQRIIATRGMAGWSAHMMPLRFFPGAIGDEMWRWYERQQAAVAPEFLLAALRLLVGADLSPHLGEIELPALLLHADASPFIPVAVMADLQARLPDAQLQVFAHARHGLPFSHGGACAAVLRGFLDRHAARAATA